MKTLRVVTAAGVCLIMGASMLVAQEIRLEDQPGYVNLNEIKIPGDAGRITEISLGPALLRLVSSLEDDENGELEKTLSGILSIQVKSYKLDEAETDKVLPVVEKIEAKLKNEKWESIVRIKEENERTNISMKYDGDKPVGLMIIAFEPGDEVTFVNVVGTIDLKSLGKMGLDLSPTTLDSLKNWKKE